MHPRTQQLIDRLLLRPHPEGGYYREVYRSELLVHSDAAGSLRSGKPISTFCCPPVRAIADQICDKFLTDGTDSV